MLKGGLTLFVHALPVMTLDDMPIFATLKSRLSYLADRQQVIAQNVANANTPGYTPKDLKPFTIPGQGVSAATLALAPTSTSPMHLTPPGSIAGSPGVKPVAAADSETTLNGNSVVLEEEMMKMNQARTDYDAAVSFYEHALALIQTASKRPGQ
jgi:flagellar basal-body rod protein FlgB